jgi:hypothetical protein
MVGGTFPLTYVDPSDMRATRDLLRCRAYLMRRRSDLLAHVQHIHQQYTYDPFEKMLQYACNRDLLNRMAEDSARLNVEAGGALFSKFAACICVPLLRERHRNSSGLNHIGFKRLRFNRDAHFFTLNRYFRWGTYTELHFAGTYSHDLHLDIVPNENPFAAPTT